MEMCLRRSWRKSNESPLVAASISGLVHNCSFEVKVFEQLR
jgi:hypothetical protein